MPRRGVTVEDCTLLRSAEVALENGFEYFVIVDQDDYVLKNSYGFD